MSTIHTILFPADFSECSGFAFYFALNLARACGARLVVLHVEGPPRYVALDREATLARLRSAYHTDSPPPLGYCVEEGDPALEIRRVAERIDCDLIVMGTHGRTLEKLLMGSVAEQVVHDALCPVLVVPPPGGHARPAEETVPLAAAR
jgi:nucleotide-binding universal stress UspA family protein